MIIHIVRWEDRPFMNAYIVIRRFLQGAELDARHLPFEIITRRVAYGILLPSRGDAPFSLSRVRSVWPARYRQYGPTSAEYSA